MVEESRISLKTEDVILEAPTLRWETADFCSAINYTTRTDRHESPTTLRFNSSSVNEIDKDYEPTWSFRREK